MGLGADHENQQWRIEVHAKKSRSFNLRITATGTPPIPSKLRDLSALLRLRGFILNVKSTSAPRDRRRHHGILKSMFRRFTQRIQRHPLAAASPAALPETSLSRLRQLAGQEPIGIRCLFVAVFVLGALAGICLRETVVVGGSAFVPMTPVALLSSAAASLPLLLAKNCVTERGRYKNNLLLLILSILLFILGSVLCNLGKHRHFFESSIVHYLWKFSKLTL